MGQPEFTSDPRHGAIESHVFGAVAHLVDRYFDLRMQTSRDVSAIESLLHPVLTRRTIEGGRLVSEDREQLLQRLRNERGETDRPVVTTVQVHAGDFAIVRADDWSEPGTTILTLFETKGAWRIAGESVASGRAGRRSSQFDPANDTQEVLRVLETYYTAVDDDDPVPLESIFHRDWLMKNPEDGVVVAETKPVFMRRLGGAAHKGYALDRQIADVQILYDLMAFVRVDKPSSPVTTTFVFYRLEGEWVIVDKMWSAGK